ncbi:MAG: hypothetical protein H7X70_07095 [Candidatus Kapabacteria bacterium]|nr:hypothetical protein [Candidatus Kapabacteria bacterium]
MIVVPSQIDNYDEVERALAGLGPIVQMSGPNTFQVHALLSIVVTVGLFATLYISENNVIVFLSGSLLIVILAYSFIEIQRSKNIDIRTKKGSWWSVFMIASTALALYFKLTG